MVGYANGNIGYICTAQAHQEGGYEPNYSDSGPGAEEVLVAESLRLADRVIADVFDHFQPGGDIIAPTLRAAYTDIVSAADKTLSVPFADRVALRPVPRVSWPRSLPCPTSTRSCSSWSIADAAPHGDADPGAQGVSRGDRDRRTDPDADRDRHPNRPRLRRRRPADHEHRSLAVAERAEPA